MCKQPFKVSVDKRLRLSGFKLFDAEKILSTLALECGKIKMAKTNFVKAGNNKDVSL